MSLGLSRCQVVRGRKNHHPHHAFPEVETEVPKVPGDEVRGTGSQPVHIHVRYTCSIRVLGSKSTVGPATHHRDQRINITLSWAVLVTRWVLMMKQGPDRPGGQAVSAWYSSRMLARMSPRTVPGAALNR